MQRLQKHGFKWEDKSFDELYEEYPNCKMALMWWCNMKQYKSFNISWNKYLKEFLIENPPTFQISNLCCTHAKKNVIHKLIKDLNYDLSIIGVRKAEGGARAVAYKNCFDENPDGCDNYRPVFWYTNKDKEEYNDFFEITLSDCYLKYGLRRTGCCGCSYAKDFEAELEIIQKYEPKLYKAVNNIFKDAYDYTRKYKEFVKKKNEENEKE
jgi:3'-phosphoadenosine 5'-phosphosulfate sulfotransferase (PAPS reductase)/FAD synthetase